MLYNNTAKSLKGKYWKMSNGNWKAINSEGTQTTCKLQVEAQRFAEKKVVNEGSYKGYSITKALTSDTYYVTKGGHNICASNSEAEAKQEIDKLTEQ